MGFDIKKGVLLKYTEEKGITDITIPEEVTCIESMAFYKCTNLKSVVIQKGVTSIGDWAFQECRNLRMVVLPEGLKVIGKWSFRECTSLREITVPEGVNQIGKWSFSKCTSLERITLPESLTSIGNWAFDECKSLKEITLPDGIKDIEQGALKGLRVSKNIAGIPMSFMGSKIKDKNDIPKLNLMFKLRYFSAKISSEMKYEVITDYYYATGSRSAGRYLKKNILDVVKYFIESDNEEKLEKLFSKIDGLEKKNLDAMVESSVDNMDKGGNAEISLLLMNYRNKKYGSTDKKFEL